MYMHVMKTISAGNDFSKYDFSYQVCHGNALLDLSRCVHVKEMPWNVENFESTISSVNSFK